MEIKLEEFRTTLQAAVRQQAIRYTASHALAIRWEEDNTSAQQDTAHFQSMLKTLQLPAAQELVIPSTDRTPGWNIAGVLRDVVSKAEKSAGRSLIMVHYAGHGKLGPNGNLLAVEGPSSNRSFDAQRCLVDQVDLLDSMLIDILFIFDCCYSFTACREPELAGRIVEIIGASDNASSSPLANSPPRNTLTAKIAGEIRCRQRQGHQYVEFADVVQALRSRENAVTKPVHRLKMGTSSICLPLGGLNIVNPLRIPPTLRAVFSVAITNDMNQQELDQFTALLRSFPPNAAIVLEGVYPTGSMCFILSSAYAVYSKLSGMRGYKLISEVTGHNRLRQPEAPGLSVSPKKENVPLSKQPGSIPSYSAENFIAEEMD
ncbi:hypothetical protein ARAM_005992 [Aspergillus rambellii]|uniref:Peptidase C14 caspase domain-containing protein n=1 Tax=Aspergillus rambellii TaxID=308745 RepID=A0A0F8VSG2_9EURO|nr:hypothetical protein ARAM_005992 [Aspergillus rambellii]